MGVLGHHPMADEPYGSAGFYHHLVEAVKQAFLDRHVIADPDFSALADTARLLDPAHLRTKAQAVNADQALDWPHVYKQATPRFSPQSTHKGAQPAYCKASISIGEAAQCWVTQAFSGKTEVLPSISIRKAPIALKLENAPFITQPRHRAEKWPPASGLWHPRGRWAAANLALLLSLLIDHGLSPEAALAQPRFFAGQDLF